MDVLIGTGIVIALALFGCVAIMKTMESKFPTVQIDVRFRGTRKRTKFRTMGDAIVKDNIVKILLGEYEFMGSLSSLDYYLAPDGKRIYDAYSRYDYLVGIKPHDKTDIQLEEKRPLLCIVEDENGKQIAKMKNGEFMLMPLKLGLVNETLSEKEVKNGKDIASGFIKAQKSAEQFINANNPVMAIIIAALPLVIFAAVLAMVVYVAYMGLGDASVKIAASAAQMGQCVK